MATNLIAACLFFGGACNKNASKISGNLSPVNNTAFINDADIWVTEMEASGTKFYNSNGTEQDIYLILKNSGMNLSSTRLG